MAERVARIETEVGFKQRSDMIASSSMTRNRQHGFTLIELMIVISIIAIIASIAIPLVLASRLAANESAAIATLKNIASAQAQIRAAGAIDCNINGTGEYGYFAELAGDIGLRDSSGSPSITRLSPPVLSGNFAVITASVVIRSGYVFQMYLPSATRIGVAEAATGGVGTTAPDPAQSEFLWCCYAWPTAYGKSGNRAFFVNQVGDVVNTSNISQRYTSSKPPTYSAAFVKGAGNAMGSTVAAGTSGSDDQVWTVIP